MRRAPFVPLLLAAVALWLGATGVARQRSDAFPDSRHHPAIGYGSTKPSDVVAQLNAKLESGQVTLTFEPGGRGYLKSVLELLQISPTSQTLVYSGTSLQASYINEKNPRAIYFNDNVAVGWIRGAPLLELASQDPRLGTVFYQLSQTEGSAPRFNRQETCLSCHLSWDTRAVPGVFVLTTFPRKSDRDYASGGVSDHREPLDRRYGGWYVTGDKVPARHMGNQPLIGPHAASPEKTPPPVYPTLAGRDVVRDIGDFLTPTSDIVALQVAEHQMHAMNLMTRAAWEHRLIERGAADAPVGPDTVPVLAPRVREAVDELADYLLFVDEVPLGTIKGNAGFAEWFAAQGPQDPAGRSLRSLTLDRRLMTYPLSYTIYSVAFDGLPPAVRQATYRRLFEVLSSGAADKRYAHLTAADRTAILEILRATKTDLPNVFGASRSAR